METKMIEWLKTHRKKIILYSLIGFVVIFNIGLLFVQVPYWIGNKVPLIKTDLYPADVLSFLGDFISAAGTIILGIIAIIQTAKAYKLTNDANNISEESLAQAKRANDLAAQMQKLEQAKFISMVSINDVYTKKVRIQDKNYYNPEISNYQIIDMIKYDFWSFTHCYAIDIKFKNNSEYPIVQLHIHGGDINNNNELLYGIIDVEDITYIEPNGNKNVRIIIPSCFFEKYNEKGVSLYFTLTNIFDYHTIARMDITNLTINGRNKEYTYQLAKYTDVK
ncbi:MAG: hypothetical protein IKJ05_02250 [Oscillospiraceae bacterium]|nr:hypothetical protein [Oscillospiraceae bacterium]